MWNWAAHRFSYYPLWVCINIRFLPSSKWTVSKQSTHTNWFLVWCTLLLRTHSWLFIFPIRLTYFFSMSQIPTNVLLPWDVCVRLHTILMILNKTVSTKRKDHLITVSCYKTDIAKYTVHMNASYVWKLHIIALCVGLGMFWWKTNAKCPLPWLQSLWLRHCLLYSVHRTVSSFSMHFLI